MSLKDARDALERSKKRRDDAERAGDLRTTSDLTYYTIPKGMRLVENLETADVNRQKDVATQERLLKEMEVANTKLERLQTRQAEAKRSEDFVTASDLTFYAIPDVNVRIQELAKEIAARDSNKKGADDSDDDSSIAEAYVHQHSFVPERRLGPRRHSLATDSSPSRSGNGATGQTDAEALAQHLAQYTDGNTTTLKDNTAAADTAPLQTSITNEEVHDEPKTYATGPGEAKPPHVEDHIDVSD